MNTIIILNWATRLCKLGFLINHHCLLQYNGIHSCKLQIPLPFFIYLLFILFGGGQLNLLIKCTGKWGSGIPYTHGFVLNTPEGH